MSYSDSRLDIRSTCLSILNDLWKTAAEASAKQMNAVNVFFLGVIDGFSLEQLAVSVVFACTRCAALLWP